MDNTSDDRTLEAEEIVLLGTIDKRLILVMIILFRLNYFGTSHKNTLPFFVTVIVDEH
jgi:hypothetical protein